MHHSRRTELLRSPGLWNKKGERAGKGRRPMWKAPERSGKMNILELSALELGRKIKAGEVTAVEAVKASLEQIKQKEPDIHAYVTVDEEGAVERAREVQSRIADGTLKGPLAGVPAAIKDNLCTRGLRTTCSSRMLYNFVPSYTAEAVVNLEKAGVVILGKTNMDEFFFALGSDTGGSIRQPSSFCGVTGIKPTYGTVSRYGLIAYGSSLDQVGPVGKNVSDCAAVLETVSSYDNKDSTSISRNDLDFTSALVEDVKGMKIGIPGDYMGEGLDEEVKTAVLEGVRMLRERGAVVEEFDLSLVEYAIPAYYVIASAEASSNLSRFDGVKYGLRAQEYEGLHQMYKKSRSEGFGPEVKRRIMLGAFVLSSGYYDAYYLKALRTKALIKQAFDKAFARYDVILGPVAPTTAPKLGESLKDPLKMYLGDIYTISVNLAGLPAMSVPCGLDGKGLPIGLQLIGDCFQEKKIIRAAYTLEKTREGR